MKKLSVALAVAGLAVTASVALAGGGAGTGINGSMHDINALTGFGYTADQWGRSCVFCHTPHNAQQVSEGLVPLWNHAQTSAQTVMTPYAWIAPTNTAIAFATDPLIGPSRLCMACHDGVTAVDSHGTAGSTPAVAGKAMNSSYKDGLGNDTKRYITDLSVTHPIGFLYQDAFDARGGKELVDKDMGFITSKLDNNFDTQTRSNLTYSDKKIKDTLYGGWMTCATCHDVHNSVNAKPEAGHSYNYFLYAQEEGSAICLSCHKK